MQTYEFTIKVLVQSIAQAEALIAQQKSEADRLEKKMRLDDAEDVGDFLRTFLGKDSNEDALVEASTLLRYFKPLCNPLEQICKYFSRHRYHGDSEITLLEVVTEDSALKLNFKHNSFKITKETTNDSDVLRKDIIYIAKAFEQIVPIKNALEAILFAIMHKQPHIQIHLNSNDVKPPMPIY